MNNKKVLLVEDDDFLRQLVGSKLTDDGFALNVAVDSVGVFTLLEKEKPDLILLDVMLPGLDGFQILEKIKSDKSNEAIPVVILSNLGQKEDKDKAFSLGAKDFWIKAYLDLDEIVEKINKIFEEKK
ncbi:hypothetical protein A2442_01130 [Candidatus Campbellbacteria bacterium RIFOXYC2_FULL_35_25]|uniref:Response regulatory domain-containing protein n=1 Tax=Candidatus Campbellbacteria bacterium RIFOXYC2_FULL_35_25 TaxID=1797582 RepID=A0A1F5EIT6_9BACT|nr:MAG: hypothetical protein A2442_01130 [Candidatus Campbellbacteria bacterium RIFOXYC2_FULL_35_25]